MEREDRAGTGQVLLSIVTPAFNESKNLPELYRRLCRTLDGEGRKWEWVVIDDHSGDDTFPVLRALAEKDGRVRAFRFSRNFGSHTAITCGLQKARGDCAVVMAADLQDPPEEIPNLLTPWREGYHLVWAVREKREGESPLVTGFARLYYALMRRTDALKDLPATGTDFFLMDRRVINAFNRFQESKVSVPALLTWMGFRQTSVPYTKQSRLHGRSGWSLRKKIQLVIDSITAFTFFPIRLISYLGLVTAVLGFGYAAAVIALALNGSPVPGWSSLMVMILVLGGIQMIMLGVVGEYLWRALEESRKRPRWLIEAEMDRPGGEDGSS